MSPVLAPRAHDFKVCLEHRRILYGFACKLTRNHDMAADLVQDTLLRAFERWHQFTPPADIPIERAVAAWLAQMMRNLFIHQWRKRKVRERYEARQLSEMTACTTPGAAVRSGTRYVTRLPPEIEVADPRSFEPPTERNLSAELRAALDVVGERNPQWRRIAEAVWLHDGEYHEVAEKLGIPIGTVMSAINRVRNIMIGRLSSYAAEAYGIRHARGQAAAIR